ncbi:uncharacterized protein LOC132624546 [Lycium barbarum]|uniref:uncharacterized protein LOC132624546 n=1 Tax=Lycium barbarum TaxID=112863 RepID=UPI00293F75F2|nr:uncharacterized protein LOC132624546 [Lycium barbarum]
MGFDEMFINLVYRLISNNWYSVIINGTRYGFFKSSRGLKQGDPLSPALFIIAAETLSRALNYLFHNDRFSGFSMHKKGPQINHLSYADDIVLFTSGDKVSIKLMMKQLYFYQKASGQEINTDKTFFLTHSKTDRLYNRKIKRWTGFKQSTFPFIYLGCPIYCGRKRIYYFSNISKKILNKIAGWQGIFLSPGGKAVVIKHILQSQALHVFAALMPPVTTLYEIEMQFANFFWGQKNGKNSYHWSSWENMSFPTKEGGFGFRSLLDICHTFAAKRWWRLRTEPSLWAQFLLAKYCQRSNPVSKVIASKDSAAWKDLLHIRDKMDININWKINSGNVLFWWDNWTLQGSLYQMINPILKPGNVKPEFLRNKNIADPIYNYIWIKEIPFKISFFMWKLLMNNLPLDASLSRFNINKGLSCCCCRVACLEIGDHVFAASELAKQAWTMITSPLGLNITGNTVQIKVAFRKKFKFIDYTWNWSKVCLMAENFKAVITSKMIKWIKPLGNAWKLNTDGSYMKNHNKAGAGGIVRNGIGNMIMAFSYPTQFCTNNYSEAKAALIGISWCVNHQFEALEVELDSMIVVQMINGIIRPPWKLQGIIEDIQSKALQRNITFKHCYREANEVADSLAKHAAQNQVPIIFLQECDLPNAIRGPLRMNKLDFPSFRRRVKKNATWQFNPP